MKADETLDDLARWRFLRPHQPEAAQRVLACFVIIRPESILDALGPFDGFADAFFEPEAGQVPGPDGCGTRAGKTEWWAEVPEPSAADLRGDEAAPAPPPDSAGGSQGPRRSSVASQTRRSSHHQVSQAPGQRVNLACVHADRAHRVHGHRPFDAPVEWATARNQRSHQSSPGRSPDIRSVRTGQSRRHQ